MYDLSTSCLILFFLFSLFHPFSCDSSKQEFGWCETQFQCGNITAGFPFSGGNRPQICGHPSLELHCFNTTTSIIISNHFYNVLHIDQISNTLRLASAELEGSFCNVTFTTTTLPSEIFELSSIYKSLTVFYLCNSKLSYRSSYTCPGRGLVSVPQNIDYRNSCQDSFIINVPQSFVPEEKELNLTHLESALNEGFEVKVKIDEKACKKCSSSNGTCGFEDTTQICCKEASSSRCSKLLSIDDLESNDCLDNNGGCWQDMSANITACKATFRGIVCECPRVDGVQLKGDGYSHCEYASLSAGTKAGIGAATGLGVAILIVAGLFCLLRRRRKTQEAQYTSKDFSITKEVACLLCVINQQTKTSAALSQEYLKALIPLKQYSYLQVKKITKSFVEVIGKGGFGTVYRGTLTDGRSVAVKILKDSKGNGEDFINEVASMSKTSHVNIVSLLGFCSEGSKRAIIYEYLENGSLDQFISSNTSINVDWMALYGIALGVARGLEYLHHGCKTRIVHFDIKPQNILLDDNLCPKVSDFGLAKLCKKKESILSLLDTRGTIGYIAPEVFSRMYGRVSHKSDVYSYGMLLLEMIGARNKERFDQNSASNISSMYFPEWIYKDLEKGDRGKLIENGISSEDEEVTKKMTIVGLWCIQPFPSDRPEMNRVVEMMEGNLDDLEVPPRPVLQNPPVPLQESSTFSEDISIYPEV